MGPVASSRDTALTIAADKGHEKFCELLIDHQACVDARNKRGNTPMWLACNGGHLDVMKLLYSAQADVNIPDNRSVTPLVATMKKGNILCCKWLVSETKCDLPSGPECEKHIAALLQDTESANNKDLLDKAMECQ